MLHPVPHYDRDVAETLEDNFFNNLAPPSLVREIDLNRSDLACRRYLDIYEGQGANKTFAHDNNVSFIYLHTHIHNWLFSGPTASRPTQSNAYIIHIVYD